MLIKKIPELKNCLKNNVVLLTGAGGGIGFETAKAFAYMGANVIIAEIDKNKGINAEKYINKFIGNKLIEFYEIDLSDENQLEQMIKYINKNYGCPEIIFNNATIAKIGAIDETDIGYWDKSYAVNLKAPLILTQKFLPKMKEKNNGIIVFVSSSGAAPYMGAYEIFKTAQVELANTLAMELEGKNIFTYTIGPGLVKTQTAVSAIEIVSLKMGMSIDEFYEKNKQHILDVETAGVGFALSVKKAEMYHGQEIGSIQVLMDFNLLEDDDQENNINMLDEIEKITIQNYLKKIFLTYDQQYNGWKSMNIFEKQWVFRDFKKHMALSVDQTFEKMANINSDVQNGHYTIVFKERSFLKKLQEYWKHQLKLLQGYEKNKTKLNENTNIINEWITDIEKILQICGML